MYLNLVHTSLYMYYRAIISSKYSKNNEASEFLGNLEEMFSAYW